MCIFDFFLGENFENLFFSIMILKRKWGIISQLPQHFMSHFSIVFIFSEFDCLLDVSLLPKVQTFVTTPFQTTGGGIFTHIIRHGIFKLELHTETRNSRFSLYFTRLTRKFFKRAYRQSFVHTRLF